MMSACCLQLLFKIVVSEKLKKQLKENILDHFGLKDTSKGS